MSWTLTWYWSGNCFTSLSLWNDVIHSICICDFVVLLSGGGFCILVSRCQAWLCDLWHPTILWTSSPPCPIDVRLACGVCTGLQKWVWIIVSLLYRCLKGHRVVCHLSFSLSLGPGMKNMWRWVVTDPQWHGWASNLCCSKHWSL